MNAFYLLLGTFLLFPSALASEPAQVRLYCNSLRFEPTTGGPGQAATLQLSTDGTFGEVNGELGPLSGGSLQSHGSFFRLEDPTFPDALVGKIAFDKPAPVDVNDNGFDDFFEVSQTVVPTTTHGFFQSPIEQGSVTADWARAAGSTTGTCRLRLVGDTFGELPTFAATFEILEYTGPFAYSVSTGTNGITGNLALFQTQHTNNTKVGRLTLSRVDTNRFDQLVLAAGTLTNAAGQTLSYPAAEIDRDLGRLTNYFGFIDFQDGDPTTSTVDYIDWVISLDDRNDANTNGIPDLSDDPGTVPAGPTSLALIRSAGQLLLSIRGNLGSPYTVEQSPVLGRTNWIQAATLVLTNSSQTIALPAPSTPSSFWRARSP